MENITDEIEAAATELMAKIDEMGGTLDAIERGFQRSEIEARPGAGHLPSEGRRLISR